MATEPDWGAGADFVVGEPVVYLHLQNGRSTLPAIVYAVDRSVHPPTYEVIVLSLTGTRFTERERLAHATPETLRQSLALTQLMIAANERTRDEGLVARSPADGFYALYPGQRTRLLSSADLAATGVLACTDVAALVAAVVSVHVYRAYAEAFRLAWIWV